MLCAERINILAPIPGSDSVGIEIPNSNKVSVFLRELLESRDWAGTGAKIPIALGKDVYGKTLVADLAAMPHMLIGGTTGSGKSVCINCILMSFLYRFSPDDLRLILIDPEAGRDAGLQFHPASRRAGRDRSEEGHARAALGDQRDGEALPHPGQGRRAQHRQLQLARRPPQSPPSPQLELNVPDAGDEDEDGPDEMPDAPIRVPREDDLVIPAKLPYIVVIIDELADLMQTAPADVESAVARLTAKARAAGIHLIVATQTPRREVVTGVIKTNIPARMAFQVPSGLDSRVILDENGAENLLGRGDLLYRPPGVGRLTRGQGAFVSDEEVQDVVKFCAAQGEAQFVPEIHNKLSGKAPADMEISEADRELIIEASRSSGRKSGPARPTSSAACASATTAPPTSSITSRRSASSPPAKAPSRARFWSTWRRTISSFDALASHKRHDQAPSLFAGSPSRFIVDRRFWRARR